MKQLYSPTAKTYDLGGILYENPENGVLCLAATQPALGDCFVKILHYGQAATRESKRLIREDAAAEARAIYTASQFSSHVPKLYDHWDDAARGRYIIVMQRASGISLRQWMRYRPAHKLSQQDIVDCCQIISRICGILRDINRLRPAMIHRDLKPENIMVRRDEKLGWDVTILDFGTTYMKRARNVGTMAYRAPEQMLTRDQMAQNTVQTDVFALGQILYEMLLGSVPVVDLDYVRGAQDRQWTQCPQLPQRVLELPAGPVLDKLLKQMTMYRMEDRPVYRDIMSQLAKVEAKPRRERK